MQINTSDLNRQVIMHTRHADMKPSYPSASTVMLSWNDLTGLRLTSFNTTTDSVLITYCDTDCDETMEGVVVQLADLKDTLKSLDTKKTAAPVHILLDDTHVRFDQNGLSIPVKRADDDYINDHNTMHQRHTSQGLEVTQVTLDANDMKHFTHSIQNTAARFDNRPILQYVAISGNMNSDRLSFATADGYRLGVAQLRTDDPIDGTLDKACIHSSLFKLWAQSTRASDKTMHHIGAYVNGAKFYTENTFLYATYTDSGKFTDYTAFIPNGCDSTIEMVGKVKHFEQIKPFAGVNKVKLVTDGNNVTLNARQELHDPFTTVSFETTTSGEPVDVAFNIVYMIDALHACRDNAQVYFQNPEERHVYYKDEPIIDNKPILVKTHDLPYWYGCVIMPMTIV